MSLETLSDSTVGPASNPSRSRLRWYRERESGKKFFLLRQTASFTESCFDHGSALAGEIETGIFPEIIDAIRVDTDTASSVFDVVLRSVFSRITADVFQATNPEFQDGVHALDQGHAKARPGREFGLQDVINACVAIDSGNIATGFARRAEKWGASGSDLIGTIGFVIGSLRRFPQLSTREADADQGRVMSSLSRQSARSPLGMGCTGFAVAPGKTMDGLSLHGRTFDGAFFEWNQAPGLHLVDERDPARPEIKHRYAAVGSAGLVYPGGISGVNDAGIACSLHQMSTTTYSLEGQGKAIAPFVQQRILREAGTLEEAVAVARSVGHFASWAILVSDAKTGRAIRIEINGHGGARDGKPEVAVSDPEEWCVQTNHFREPGMEEQFDHFGDAHFTKSVGKWMETRSRLAAVTGRLQMLIETGQLGTSEAIQLLAGHDDAWLEGSIGGRPSRPGRGTQRAFGRTVCKAYGLMASIVRADPDRSRARDEIWFTIGERLPGPHARHVGFRIDWDAMDLTPAAAPVRAAATIGADMRRALAHYVEAFRTMARPKINGRYLGRDPRPDELVALRAKALQQLGIGLAHAENERGTPDVTFRYIRARLAHEDGRYEEAARDWKVLTGLVGAFSSEVQLHDYDRALILILSGATEYARNNRAEAEALLAQGEARLDRVKGIFDGKAHPGISKWKTTLFELRQRGAAADLPEIDFVTVE